MKRSRKYDENEYIQPIIEKKVCTVIIQKQAAASNDQFNKSNEFNESKDSEDIVMETKESYNFFRSFLIVKLMIMDYFVDEKINKFSNYSKDLHSLLISSKWVNHQILPKYMEKARFTFEDALRFNTKTRNLILELSFTGTIIKKLLTMTPNIRCIILTNCQFTSNCIPDSVRCLIFEGKHKEIILIGDFPETLHELHLPDNFYQKMGQRFLPLDLRILYFGASFNQKIDPGILPNGLTILRFGNDYNLTLDYDVLPQSVTNLKFGSDYRHVLSPGILPKNLTTLEFGFYYEARLIKGALPESLTELKFGKLFNKPIDQGVFPKNLIKLTFGLYFNQSLNQGILPILLYYLVLGSYFNQPMDARTLPQNLQHLEMSSRYTHSLISILPNLVSFTLSNNYYNKSLKHLKLMPGLIPKTVKKLKLLDYKFNQSFSL